MATDREKILQIAQRYVDRKKYDRAIEEYQKIIQEDPKDARLVDAFNQHQQTDKGFGEALGPFAADRITKLFKVARFRTVERDSSWHLGPDQAELQKMVLKGWVQAVVETQLIDPDEGDSWLERRLELIERGELQISISHKDVAAFPK